MKIRVINPTYRYDRNERALATYKMYASDDTDLSIVSLTNGPESIEGYFDVALAVPDILIQARSAENEEVDAIVLDCMADPGLFAIREAVSIPVVGAAQASMYLAAILADQFSVITMLERMTPLFNTLWRTYSLTGKGVSVRAVDIPVTQLRDDESVLIAALIAQSIKAVEDDGAHAIVFGCTGMSGLAKPVKTGLEDNNIDGIPVIDPTGFAIRLAEDLVALQLSHSKRSFYSAPKRPIMGYDFL
jgi:allantoin racemase